LRHVLCMRCQVVFCNISFPLLSVSRH
jgi:hypothetical protein